MTLAPSRSGRFKKDYKLMTRRGKDVSKILRTGTHADLFD
jgi:mRNA-degrading endonuclease YafQ of YafQ-DinJ toxin-antitoxin module